MSRKADELTPEEAVAALSETAVVCRDLSHNWGAWYASRIPGGFERGLRCSTCATTRIEFLNSYGMLVGGRRYEYPEGYLVPGSGRPNADFRAKVRLRTILSQVEEEKPKAKRSRKKVTGA